MLHASTYSALICLTQIGHYRLKRFCFIVEQIACLFNAGVGGVRQVPKTEKMAIIK